MKIGGLELLALSKLPGVGNSTLREICVSDIELTDLRKSNKENILPLFKGNKKEETFSELFENFDRYLEYAEKEIYSYSIEGIKTISYNDPLYPRLYRLLKDFPPLLFVKGNTQLLDYNRNAAVIGTRENTSYGFRVARSTAMHFAHQGFNIVSGLAEGIDAIAHHAALDAGGLTTAILVDVKKIYPASNKALADKILSNDGLLISEAEPGSPVQRSSFVERDRLQSGLSLGVFAIETDIKGGTMHTVGYAQKQNRLLFCPDIFVANDQQAIANNPKARGIIELLRSGSAKPYTKLDYEKIISQLSDKSRELLKEELMFPLKVNSRLESSSSELSNNVAEISTTEKITGDGIVDAIKADTIQPANDVEVDNNDLPVKGSKSKRKKKALEVKEDKALLAFPFADDFTEKSGENLSFEDKQKIRKRVDEILKKIAALSKEYLQLIKHMGDL